MDRGPDQVQDHSAELVAVKAIFPVVRVASHRPGQLAEPGEAGKGDENSGSFVCGETVTTPPTAPSSRR